MNNKLKSFLTHPEKRWNLWSRLGLLNWMSDEMYLKIAFKKHLSKELNLHEPKTFNEKLQWLKLYDRKPEYTMMVDKYKVREYIAQTIGEQYLIPLLGVWKRAEEIDFKKLPKQFVLKCNHNSGFGICICTDKDKLDIVKVKKKLSKALAQNYYFLGREWPYREVPRLIIAEQYMCDSLTSKELTDYKFMCFNGEVKLIFTCTERYSNSGLKVTFFDLNWNRLEFTRHYPATKEKIAKPKNLKKMIKLAEKLSANIPFVRVDFYEINNKVYFGELTFYPGSGMEEFEPEIWDERIGEWLVLPKQK